MQPLHVCMYVCMYVYIYFMCTYNLCIYYIGRWLGAHGGYDFYTFPTVDALAAAGPTRVESRPTLFILPSFILLIQPSRSVLIESSEP